MLNGRENPRSTTTDDIYSVSINYEGQERTTMSGSDNFYEGLFPYDIYSVSINYEGQERTTMSGSDNFYEGTAPYILSGWWQYSSAS